VTLDRFDAATRPGGAALYAAITADRLGLAVGLLTSHGDDFPLELIPSRIEVVAVPADQTTRFDHRPGETRRSMRVETTARPIAPADVPADWRDAPLVLLAPVLDEVDPLLVAAFTEAAIGAAAQGWLRRLGPSGEVEPSRWDPPAVLLGRLQTLFLSHEDISGQEASALEWFQRVPVGALTAGSAGALLFVNGERYEVRPRAAREAEATGAGDVFATTFLVEYQRTGDPWEAAAAAACAGSLAVEGEGWTSVPDRARLAAVLSDYRRGEEGG